eukprot:2522458-Amphidinium_carterae.3
MTVPGQAVVKVVACIYRLGLRVNQAQPRTGSLAVPSRGRHMEKHLSHELKLQMAVWWMEEILDEQLHEPYDEDIEPSTNELER